jgi:hypothetical protein
MTGRTRLVHSKGRKFTKEKKVSWISRRHGLTKGRSHLTGYCFDTKGYVMTTVLPRKYTQELRDIRSRKFHQQSVCCWQEERVLGVVSHCRSEACGHKSALQPAGLPRHV